MKKYSRGFTMIELIFVIVILGILSGVALPRFINQTSNARKAAMNGVAGAVASAVALSQAEWAAEGSVSAATSVNMNGTSVSIAPGTQGRPDGNTNAATGIVNALQNFNGFSITSGATATIDFSPNTVTNCDVTYTTTTGVVAVVTSGC